MRIGIVLVLVAVLSTVSPGVSGACACGAFVADRKLQAQQETALVELTGRTEAITLAVQAHSDASQAAFLMPVPARARFEVAEPGVFVELDRISRPEVRTRRVVVDGDGMGGAPQQRGATVVDHVEVGPYEVAQLSGTDSSAVQQWLGEHGFVLPTALGGALTPYLAENWLVVAVRLAPSSGSLADGLPPMRVVFETDEPVYPMRLSATAERVQPLRLYVLADHRVDVGNPAPKGREPELTFAGTVDRSPDHPELSALLSGPRFLTRYDAEFRPDLIEHDIKITRSATDDHHRAVVVVTEYVHRDWTWLFLVVGGLLLAAGVVVAVRVRSRSRSS
ncbi:MULTISPECIES: DUF2330 domain-containing protein [unclassified Saccharothrix]|uniref:DUF2330 domain-containing protein n=1 Tax=unclassified Saccharothrix TaxID=2593673 RepID=UPI00307F88F6